MVAVPVRIFQIYLSLQNDILQLEPPFALTKDIANKIETLWNNTDIKETLKQKHIFKCPEIETVSYFLTKIAEIASSDYCPTYEDYLQIYTQSKGLEQTAITTDIDTYGEYIFEFTDIGGQKSEIKKWIKFIAEDIHAVLFVISLEDYNCNNSDEKSNSILDAIQLFETIAISGKGKLLKEKQFMFYLINSINLKTKLKMFQFQLDLMIFQMIQ